MLRLWLELRISRLPVKWRRRICRVFGHLQTEGVIYSRKTISIGTGCARCTNGTVKQLRRRGPIPHPDYRRQIRRVQ